MFFLICGLKSLTELFLTTHIRKHMNSVFLCSVTEYRFSILNFHIRRFCNLRGSRNLSSALQFYIRNANCWCSFSLHSLCPGENRTDVFTFCFAYEQSHCSASSWNEESPVSWLKGCFTQPQVCAICIADGSIEHMHLLLNRVIIWNVGDCL